MDDLETHPDPAQQPSNGSVRPAPVAQLSNPDPRGGLSSGAIIAIGGGLVLFIVMAAAVVFGVSRVVAGPPASTTPAATAASTVEDYLTAIAEGDATAAKGYISTLPADTSLLTDDVLEFSNSLAPMTEIEVEETKRDGGYRTVTARYLLGGEPVTAEYEVDNYGQGEAWEIAGGLGVVPIVTFAGLGMTMNDEPVSGNDIEVFPGTYELKTTLPNFALTGETTMSVSAGYSSVTENITPVLSDIALEQFRSLVRTAVDTCVASTQLAAGCGLDLPVTLSDGGQLAEGSIVRQLRADTRATIDSLVPSLSRLNPTLAQGEFLGSVETTGDCVQDGRTGRCSVWFGPSLGSPSIDMAPPTPTVEWD